MSTHTAKDKNYLLLDLKEKILDSFPWKNIDSQNVLQVTRQAMVFAADYKHLSGKQKKALVLQAVHELVDEVSSDSDIVKLIVAELAPAVIDDLFRAFKGDFTFEKSKRKFCPCR